MQLGLDLGDLSIVDVPMVALHLPWTAPHATIDLGKAFRAGEIMECEPPSDRARRTIAGHTALGASLLNDHGSLI